MTYYLAVDIGASSGRHVLGHVENGRLLLEEIYRFENKITNEGGVLCWNIDYLVREVKRGLARAGELGRIPTSVAIDTWGVDYVLLGGSGEPILPVVSYRDPRTVAASEEVARIMPQEELYALTGIQKQTFNTVYQLWCDKESGKLAGASRMLMIPDYISYALTGVMKSEYTNATTSNLVNARSYTWDNEIISRLGLPERIFGELYMPGECVGRFKAEVEAEVGYSAEVVLCPSHDTAAAVAGIPIEDGGVYISSGTWSLIGTECREPVLTADSREANLTNEGGIEHRFRLLKNIMGMWLFQSVRRELGGSVSYDEMMKMAMASSYRGLIDPKDPAFLHPDSMIEAVRSYLGEPELALGDVLSSIYHSLAASYREAVLELERVTGRAVSGIAIVGGGSRDEYLNSLTAQYTAKAVTVGITEATATGNLISQIMRHEGINLDEARKIVNNSFDLRRIKA